MATLPAYWQEAEVPEAMCYPESLNRLARARAERDEFQLRALPFDDVVLYTKAIDNSRLVRQADPRARGACWSAILAACALLALATGALAPGVANTMAGYRLQALQTEERRLLDERQTLKVQEAELLNPARLAKIAKDRTLDVPRAGQVYHLNGKGDGAVAMVRK